jgi:transcriptional regulator with XRE-family HTH domain
MTRPAPSNRLREHRRRLGLTATAVSKLLGTSAQTVCRIETGEQTLTLAWINKFAEALKVHPEDVLPLSDDIPRRDEIITSLREEVYFLKSELLGRDRKIMELERRLTLIRDQIEGWETHG